MGHHESSSDKELKVTSNGAVAFALLIIVLLIGLMTGVHSLSHSDGGHGHATEAHAH
ncbi:MAG TPA: hypothetical protein PKX92_09130 [Edaphocola sp.]|nr:hypothetical protein [Edaphocola sp.]